MVKRIVVLGASNVVLGLPEMLTAARESWHEPLDVLAAIGHGRSYGMSSRILGRELPSILECDLWNSWSEREDQPTAALITDIGNDLAYGTPVRTVANWIQECAERLSHRCERLVFTELPLASLARLGPRRFRFFRSVLFPRSRLSHVDAAQLAVELNECVRNIAAEFGARLIVPRIEWYGLDPIHIRRRWRAEAWRNLMDAWSEPPEERPLVALNLRERWRLRRARPHARRLFGVEQRQEQPAWTGADGTRVSLF